MTTAHQKPGPTIRDYRLHTDLDACLRIWRQGSKAGHPFLSDKDLDEDEILVRERYMPGADIRVAERKGEIVGFIALAGAFIGALFVDPAHQGAGVGRALIEDARRRRPMLELEVYAENSRARAFYERLGFITSGARASDDRGRPHALIAMRLDDGAA